MTPELKARELVEKFKDAAKNQIFKNWDYYHKQCALIAVDELIDCTHSAEIVESAIGKWINKYCYEYWQQVKQAIEKM